MFKKILVLVLFYTTAFAIGGVSKFGSNADIDTTGLPEDVWSAGGAYPFPSSAAATTIVSTITNDVSAAGSGARTVQVIGLDSNYAELIEDVGMSGTGAVTLANQFLRINGAKVLTAGAEGTNSGAIQIKHSSTVIGEIKGSFGEAGMAVFTMPKTGELKGWSVNAYGIDYSRVTFQLQVREFGGAWRVVDEMGVNLSGSSTAVRNFATPVGLPFKTDIRVRATDAGVSNTQVSARFDIEYAD